jgi:hypothetical protein
MIVYGFGFLFVGLNTIKESLWKYSGSEQVENKTLTEIA